MLQHCSHRFNSYSLSGSQDLFGGKPSVARCHDTRRPAVPGPQPPTTEPAGTLAQEVRYREYHNCYQVTIRTRLIDVRRHLTRANPLPSEPLCEHKQLISTLRDNKVKNRCLSHINPLFHPIDRITVGIRQKEEHSLTKVGKVVVQSWYYGNR